MNPRALLVAACFLVLVGAARSQDAPPTTDDAETTRLEKLIADADAKTNAKAWKSASDLYKQAISAIEESKVPKVTKEKLLLHALYDWACCLAAGGAKDDAIKVLELLKKGGFTNWEHVAHDEWLAPLRGMPAFEKLIAGVKKPEPKPSPAAPTREFLDAALYRSPDGETLLPLPEHDGWSVHPNGAGALVLYQGDPKSWTAEIAIDTGIARVAKDAKDAALAKSAATVIAKDMVAKTPWLATKDDFAGSAVKVASGAAGHEVVLQGTDEKVGAWTALAVVVAHGARATSLVVWANAKSAKAAFELVQKLADGLRQGDQVARLPERKPGTALRGVWRGPYEIQYGVGGSSGIQHWLVFDERGYATWDESPDSERWVNLETLWQSGERRRLYGYTFDGATLELTGLADSKKRTFKLQAGERKLQLDGKEYERVDGGFTDGARLAGRWECSSFYSVSNGPTGTFSASSSSTYVFKEDGTFQSAAVASATLSDTSRPGVLAGSDKEDHGTYVVKGDRLVLTYCHGTVVEKTFYAERIIKDAKPPFDSSVLFIGGSNFLRGK